MGNKKGENEEKTKWGSQWPSRDVEGGVPRQSPQSEHFTGPFNR